MKFGIIGNGGREHALCISLLKSKNVSKIYCFPGNAGTEKIAENVQIDTQEFEDLKNFIVEKKIDFIVVGPEKPLVDGLVDYLEKHNINVFGPNKIASQLEGSKIFTKELCKKYNIPTAKFGIFNNINDTDNYLTNCTFPIVIKADGLAAGKGVYICENKIDATNAVQEIFAGKFGKADKLLIEEFLKGEEMSFFIISDGKTYKKFGTAQDHKRVLEGDKGKNTGGMGAYSPSRMESNELDNKIIDKIINPTLKGLVERNTKFRGFLYAGLMIIDNEPFLIEYNVRMGDPECQTILPKLKSDLAKIIEACCLTKLNEIDIDWHDDKTLCIVLCSKGYPEKYKNDLEINFKNLKLNPNEFLFHAGTKYNNNKIVSNGGRVLNFVIRSNNFKQARISAVKLIEQINWENGFFRKDIGYKVIDQ